METLGGLHKVETLGGEQDMAVILGFKTASDAVRGLEEDEKGMKKVPTLGGANTRDAVLRHCKGVVKRDTLTNARRVCQPGEGSP